MNSRRFSWHLFNSEQKSLENAINHQQSKNNPEIQNFPHLSINVITKKQHDDAFRFVSFAHQEEATDPSLSLDSADDIVPGHADLDQMSREVSVSE